MIRNLYLAYAATWVIHLGYLRFLAAKHARLAREERELDQTQGPKAQLSSRV